MIAAGVAAMLLLAAASPADAQTYRTTRPIRGVKLRPPANLTGPASLDESLRACAHAGFTDIFLETFYWGVSTGKAGTFNARFPVDYLAAAIRMSAGYNMRVHAWCEIGYWQYQSVGAYNFTINPPGQSQGDPAWRVVHVNPTTTLTGDQADQGFVNLAHPGPRAKLVSYVAELAKVPGLCTVFADYCRYPIDDTAADAYSGPWSYDAWSRTTFQSIYGSDPITTAAMPGQSLWNTFVSWRRDGITQTVGALYRSVKSANPTMIFAIDVPPSPPTNSAQFAKMQDWPTWASTGICDVVSPMCYSSTLSGIASEIATTRSYAAGKPLWVALALTGSIAHPDLTSQLNTAKANNVEDVAIFKSDVFLVPARQVELSSWLSVNATRQRGDLNSDLVIDARDWAAFTSTYTGTPVSVNPGNARLNYDANTVINESDFIAFKAEFARWHFGEDGVDPRDLDALLACWGDAAAPGINSLHLYDLNADAIVDAKDCLILLSLMRIAPSMDADVNADGRYDIEDLYAHARAPTRDINRDGMVNAADTTSLIALLRAGEAISMSFGRR